jgi:alpha-tubulin suppressor-like RCC1 family protein
MFGELGTGDTAPDTCAGGGPCSDSPVTATGVTSPVALSAGSFSSCALAPDCSVACWGFNAYGQLGDGTTTNRATAVSVVGL